MKADQRYGMWAVTETDTRNLMALFDTRIEAIKYVDSVDYEASITPVQIVIETVREG